MKERTGGEKVKGAIPTGGGVEVDFEGKVKVGEGDVGVVGIGVEGTEEMDVVGAGGDLESIGIEAADIEVGIG